MEPLLGSIVLFGGNFEPRGWAFCNGQPMQIAQHSALFSLLGTTYGGDGVSTFHLPDLRGRVPVHPGAGKGLPPRRPGDVTGRGAFVPAAPGRVPPHTQDLVVADVPSSSDRAQGDVIARSPIPFDAPVPAPSRDPSSFAPTGGGRPHDTMQPGLCVNYIIALEGIYPSRN